MSFECQEPTDEKGSSPWLNAPGHFHVVVMEQDPQPLNKNKDGYIDGLFVKLGVLAGTDASQVDKQTDQIFFRGKQDDKDGGEFANLKLHKLFVATGVKNGLNPGQRTSIDTSLMVGRQFIIEIEAKPDSRNPSITRHQIKGARIFHIDDPEVAGVPKNQEALAMIEPELRRAASSFTPANPNATMNHNPAGNTAGHSQQPGGKKPSPLELLQASKPHQQPPQTQTQMAASGAVDPGSV